ncbi:ABC transporter permease subunit [Amorphoplanes digitatis]|uniref:ABC transporter permease n=1 Tax=Actinoplanes digitatis TaxID=1868 RepID=A0A7W7HRT4_9ACTN|nr:ABC transporter permease subunit [Actinoplanes digitatis]MBB4759569.1 hypothetical protein [Actinoplanes digitatis]GID94966.1 hypothetical protein Adi01nite_43780 [Actinoplanes digitatis]
MSLFLAETRRLVKRRFARFLVIGTLLVLAAILAGTFVTNHSTSERALAAAQAQADRDYQGALTSAAEEMRTCLAARGTAAAANHPPGCDIYQPSRRDYLAEYYLEETFNFRVEFGDMIITLAAMLAVMAFLVGATFVGAEWSSGGMMNLLLWRPQRLRVLGTKLGALLVALTALTVPISAAWTGLFVALATQRGTMYSMTSGAWQSFVLMELRGLVLVLVAGAIGFALASIGRQTAMALGSAIGAVIVLQVGLYSLLSLSGAPFAEAYLAPLWILAWMDKLAEVTDWDTCVYSSATGCVTDTFTITWPMAGGALLALAVLVVGAAMWTMRSRDIT